MKKTFIKAFIFISLTVLSTICFGLTANAEVTYTYSVENDEVTIESAVVTGENQKVVIPEEVMIDGDTYPVTTIGSNAFASSTGLAEVVIPDSIIKIEGGAFRDCTALKTVTIGVNVTAIGSAFYNCTNLENLYWNAKCVGDFIPASLGGRGQQFGNAGRNGSGINVVFGDTVESIPASVFHIDGTNNTKHPLITSVELGKNIKRIGRYAFYGCDMTSVELPEGLLSIGDATFIRCENLISVNLPESLEEIGRQAFGACYSLTSIKIPDKIVKINEYTFSSCSNLAEVSLGSNVETIGERAFDSCAIEALAIPDSVKTIGNFAFAFNYELAVLNIGSGVESIGYRAFSHGTMMTELIIPDNVKSIGEEAFYKCSGLTSVTIGNGVERIERCTFWDCYNIISVIFPPNLKYIGEQAFSGCSKLKTLDLPDTVTEIGYSAFYNCDALTTVDLPDSITSLGKSAFSSCGALAVINLPKNLTIINENSFLGCSQLKNITIPNTVTYIANSAFGGCSNLENVVFPTILKSIGESAFSGCSKLKTLDLPDTLTEIGRIAFRNCDALTVISLPKYLTTIADYSFEGCGGLETILIPDTVITIDNRAFQNCRKLKDVYYSGSKKQWNNISIGTYNTNLTNAAIHYSKFEVTYNYSYNYGTSAAVESKIYTSGEKADLSVTAVREGKEFLGWNTNPKAHEALTEFVVTDDVTLYAIWKVPYSQTSKQNESFVVTLSEDIPVGSKVYFACYLGDKLTDIKTQECISASETMSFNSEKEYDAVKIFVWDNNFSPITTSETVDL